MATATFPHLYQVKIDWSKDSEGQISSPEKPTLLGGPPPQFDGKQNYWSPEDLFISSVGLCMMTTFISVAKKDALNILKYSCQTLGKLEKTKEGLMFTEVKLQVELQVSAGQEQLGQQLLDKAKKYCLISNSLKCPVILEAKVSA